jgi:hypothetical protein
MLKKILLGAAASAFALGLSTAASAAQYITQLEYDSNGLHVPSYGTVTITELDANNVDVLVDFGSLVDKITDTGVHVAFAFNLVDSPNSTVTFIKPADPTQNFFSYAGEGSFSQSPFGTFTNAVVCQSNCAGSHGFTPPLEFKVTNTSGLTFVGAGNHFTSNTTGTVAGKTGGWWFAVDTYDADRPAGANTYTVAGRDFCVVGQTCGGGVPEPASWALMILGFGSAGAMLRRRRAAVA